jgi:hypothetical protein
LPSAINTATTNANVSTAITINATTAVSVFTGIGLCFCHYRHLCFCMCCSHHNHHFCHSCCRFLADCCLTHCCHYPTNAVANAANNATATTPCLPKPPQMSCCCHFIRCGSNAYAAFVFERQRLLFALLVIMLPIVATLLSLLMC